MHNPEIFVEMSIEDGITFVSKGKEVKSYIDSQRVSTASGSALFVEQKNNLVCVCCQLKASKWIAFKAKNQPPVLNLYGENNNKPILFTRDHIIPKVFGGNDNLQNLRVMCNICNEKRSCILDDETLEFYYLNMNELILFPRLESSIERLKKGLMSHRYQISDASIITSNFKKIFSYLEMKNALTVDFQNYQKEIDYLHNNYIKNP